jgi:hypothetical protein
MRLLDYSRLRPQQLEELRCLTYRHETLADVVAALRIVATNEQLRALLTHVVVQDEFTIDVVVPWVDGLVLVYDTT